MKVLLNCLSAASGGALCYLRNVLGPLGARFDAAGESHQLAVLACRSQEQVWTHVAESRRLLLPGPQRRGYTRWRWERRCLGRLAQAEGADVLFVPYQVAPPTPGIRQVLMLRNMEPFRFHQYRYGWPTALRNWMLRRESVRSLRRADRVIAVSDTVWDFCHHDLHVPDDKLYRIYHGRDVDLHQESDGQADHLALDRLGLEGNFVFTCGSLLPYRRTEDVIAAFAALGVTGQLAIAGAGADPRYRRRLRQAAARSGCAQRLIFCGHVSPELMRALYRRCRVLVTATEVEACPNIALEAMGAGCVIVAADHRVHREIFGPAALFYEPRDIADLARALHSAWHDAALRQELQRQAQQGSARFCWQRCADETFDALVNW